MDKVQRHMDICLGLNKLYERKNHDYGDSFHDTFVEEGMAMARIRLSDKLGRFKKLSRAEGEQKVADESIRDTLLDLANYSIMTVMEMDILAEEDEKTKQKETGSFLNNDVYRPLRIPQGPCKECGYFGREPDRMCVTKAEWDLSRKESVTNASETEQADGR